MARYASTSPRLLTARPLSDEEMREGALLTIGQPRPRTRGECKDGLRPCPWAACRHHLALDVNPDNGSIRALRTEVLAGDFSHLPETCALDVADRGGAILDEVAQTLGVVRERIRQIEERTLERLNKRGHLRVFTDQE